MQLITDDYKQLNEKMHEKSKMYGTSGVYYLDEVKALIEAFKTEDVLDYGCGKSTLANNLPFTIKQYDPAVKRYESLPESADIVVCTDVFEHVEPECIDNVLTHLSKLTKKIAYLVACTIPAQKTLPDGRNAHILLRPARWWIIKLCDYFDIVKYKFVDNNAIFIVKPFKKEF